MVIKYTEQQRELLGDLDNKMSCVCYFDNTVQLFFFDLSFKPHQGPLIFKSRAVLTGNDNYLRQALLDMKQIRENENSQAWRTNSSSIDSIYEAEERELKALSNAKFEKAEVYKGFKSQKAFAEYEAADFRSRYEKYFPWFPIAKQWVEYLEKFSDGNTKPEEKKKNQIPENDIRALQVELMNLKILTESGPSEISIGEHKLSAKHLIYESLCMITSHYRIPHRSEVQRSVASIWKIKAKPGNVYEAPAQNMRAKYQDYIKPLEQFLKTLR